MFDKRLRELRLEKGYTLEQVGQFIGIKKSSYASYESAYRQPSIQKLKSLSKLYGVSVDYILGLTEDRNMEQYMQYRVKEMCMKRGLHWDGMDIPEDVAILLEKVLNEVVEEKLSTGIQSEGCP